MNTLSRPLLMAQTLVLQLHVEDKQGYSKFEMLCEELQRQELREKAKKEKKKKRKKNKKNEEGKENTCLVGILFILIFCYKVMVDVDILNNVNYL